MNKSEQISELAVALVAAQKEIKAAIKDASNPFFKSRYADLASVIEAVRMPLNKAGITFLQPVSAAEHGVSVDTILLHTSGQWISETLVMPVTKDDAQGVGSAITYARRYGLQSMCGVPTEDDDGNAATKAAPLKASAPSVATDVWNSLDDKTRSTLTDLATVTKEYLDDGDIDGAAASLESAGLDVDSKVALWSRFDSKQRSALKRAIQVRAINSGMHPTQPAPL